MPYTASHYRVADYAHWKHVWETNHSAHQSEGVRRQHLLRHPTDPNQVVLIREFDDHEQARRYLESAPRRQRMQASRVEECIDYLPEA